MLYFHARRRYFPQAHLSIFIQPRARFRVISFPISTLKQRAFKLHCLYHGFFLYRCLYFSRKRKGNESLNLYWYAMRKCFVSMIFNLLFIKSYALCAGMHHSPAQSNILTFIRSHLLSSRFKLITPIRTSLSS